MFPPQTGPRVFALPPGVDFGAELVRGLRARSQQLGEVDIFVNTQRMRRRLTDLLCDGHPALLPRIRLITDPAQDPVLTDETPTAPLRRKLELARLVGQLVETQADLAKSSVFALTDSLLALLAEMEDEGVTLDDISALDVSDESGHWARAKAFIEIAVGYASDGPGSQMVARRAVEALIERWQIAPPEHPVLLAGSTASRGTTAMLAEAIARLPQGALILPGFDQDMPEGLWQDLSESTSGEDHPQFRFARLLQRLDLTSAQITPWTKTPPHAPERNALVSLALRPAPATESWMRDGPSLRDLPAATEGMTLLEAPSSRIESAAIALRMRAAAAAGETIALISPDRSLTRRVAAALDRWHITPDDSAGVPLHLSAPGRLLRDCADFLAEDCSAQSLLALLKHPLAATPDRGAHLRWSHELELDLRRFGPAFPDAAALRRWAERHDGAEGWANWVASLIEQSKPATRSLADHVARHLALAEALSQDPAMLWGASAGRAAQEVMQDLQTQADAGDELSPRDYAALVGNLLQGVEVHDRDAGHPHLLIWGTLEARVQSAPTVILGGLNEGSWPQLPGADPWLNRRMRAKAGLLLPERRIGLAAHDFQQAIAAPQVLLTRALRDDETETVPSRWLNRLTNLMAGLPDGAPCLEQMRERGARWVAQAEAQDRPTAAPKPAPRPSPRPPSAARPSRLRVTDVATLGRDPYALYVREVLRLRELEPLVMDADARDRGTVLHKVMEQWINDLPQDQTAAKQALIRTLDTVLSKECPWPVARVVWRMQMEQNLDQLVAQEWNRQDIARPAAVETTGEIDISGVVLHGRADRIDIAPDERAVLYDYKTGTPPTKNQQLTLDKQLLVEAAMIEQGAFAALGPRPVMRAEYLQIGSKLGTVPAPLGDAPPSEIWADLSQLIARWTTREQGYTSRMAADGRSFGGAQDHLARYGEWDESTPATPEDVG